MTDDPDFLFPPGECVHRPVQPPRAAHTGERVYSDHWIRLMATPDRAGRANGKLLDILEPMPGPLTQRHATVAASFVCWLGTNCGQAFYLEEERLARVLVERSRGFIAAWAIENSRRPWVNRDVRTIEAFLAPEDHFRQGFSGTELGTLPGLSTEDHETVEHVVRWLADAEGTAFVRGCQYEVEYARRSAAAGAAQRLVYEARPEPEWVRAGTGNRVIFG